MIMISLFLFLSFTQAIYSQTNPEPNKSEAISEGLSEIVIDGKAPGIIAAIISSEGVVTIASAGLRKFGSDIAFTTNDVVHLGSCTKAMTAVMLATLVEEGKLSWESKLIDVIPELKESIHPDYHETTLWQLLTHRAGFPDLWTHNRKETKERRLQILKKKLSRSPSNKIGDFNYSNLGYVGAACMAEKITGLSWEVLMKKQLFGPLGMNSAGFGAPGTSGETDQPWGHHKSGSSWQADQSDCAEALGPAGRVHCTIEDWAKFLSLFLSDKNPILKQEYINKLIEPIGFYAGGWGVADKPWAKGDVMSHNGSNGIWYSSVLVAPKLDRAFIVSTNSRDFGNTEDLCSEMITKLIRMELNISSE